MKTIKTYECECGEDFYEDDTVCLNCQRLIEKGKLKEVRVVEVVNEKPQDPSKRGEVIIASELYFRSKPTLNMTNDMVKVEIITSCNNWHELKKVIKTACS